MSTLRLATAANVRAFHGLSDALSSNDGSWTIDAEALQDEIGRFRVWSGNLGALQKGHSSLDYRLRDSPLLSGNTLKLLEELSYNVDEAYAVVSGARLPYEAQSKPEEPEPEGEDDGFFSADEDDEEDDSSEHRSELTMRFEEIVDIIDNLYKLSVRIRTPTIRSRSLKAASYAPKDADTGVDVLSTYAGYDLQHVQELLSHLRLPHLSEDQHEQDFLTARLSAAVTLRRRQFKYWKRHRDKLAASTISEDVPQPIPRAIEGQGLQLLNETSEAQPAIPVILAFREASSHKTGKTLLSGTEATHHHQSLDEMVDTKSVTSYAVTVKDIHGRGVELPPPPKGANEGKDFECPYCYIICPARYGRGRPWRTHLLQDLQPYSCTYPDCDSPELLFRSRREWAEHEASHRKVWRCAEHPEAVYKSPSGLENHLRQEHLDSFPESQLSKIVELGEASTVDLRPKCPICHASADMEGLGGFHNHIANHLERIATFALPHGVEDASEGASGDAHRGGSTNSGSQDTRLTGERDQYEDTDIVAQEAANSPGLVEKLDPGRTLLSADSLKQLPDESQNRVKRITDRIFNPNQSEDEGSDKQQADDGQAGEASADLDIHLEQLTDTPGEEDARSGSPGPIAYEEEDERLSKQAILSVSGISTLRSLYRSSRILQRDQSYAPNDSYNMMISFCYHDLTRLKVDAIVNSSNVDMKVSKATDTLNRAVHKAGGPEFTQETNSKARLKPGQVELTQGHALPCSFVIHAASPLYGGSVKHLNILTECYRNALKVAGDHEMKTLAFPCIGTGLSGFPPRVAARIALQEVRGYLDAHADHHFERIIFCVNSAADEKAYLDFFPVFFPPTHGDLDRARTSDWSANRAALATQALETRAQVQKAKEEIWTRFGQIKRAKITTTALSEIDNRLASIRSFLLGPQELKRSLGDLNLLCSVLLTVCDSIKDMTELAKDTVSTGRKYVDIWNDNNAHMVDRHEISLGQFLEDCAIFASILDKVLTQGDSEDDTVATIRQRLESYGVKQKGQDSEGIRDHLDEALYVRESQREVASYGRDVVRLTQVSSVANLYLLGELETKQTMAQSSAVFNEAVCLVREDITRLNVDIIVNSTDTLFLGMGTLDRTVLKKGGSGLQEEVKKFGECKEGDVKLTAGYLLPAKHILHVIPPEQYRKNTKEVLRNIYREVLHTALQMKATSIAIPSIGTGMLNYPRRDCASLAMEEVKRFLESAEPTNLIEKIIFVVYSSSDEFIYKSLLPIYFPSPQQTAPPPSGVHSTQKSSRPAPAPRRSLFGSVSEAIRGVRSGKQPEASRSINSDEEHALIGFEKHAKYCVTCKDIDGLYAEGRDLCDTGYRLAQTLLQYMNMLGDGQVYVMPDLESKREKLEVPADMFPFSLCLLRTVEKSSMDTDRNGPFVSQSRQFTLVPNSSEGTSKFGYSLAPLDAQILDYLTEDLRSRPGSYIGQHTNEIASALNQDPVAISTTLQELAARQLVHNTTDGSTWVISHTPTELPALSQQSAEEGKPDIYLLAAKVLSFMEHMNRISTGHEGQTVRELAAALQLHTSDVWATIRHLTARGQIYRSADEEIWAVTPKARKVSSEPQEVTRDTAPDAEPPSANEESSTDSLSERALRYLQRLGKIPERGEHISDLASSLNTSIAELSSVLPKLRAEGVVENTIADSYWAATLAPKSDLENPNQSAQQEASWVPSIELTHVELTLPTPFLNIEEYVTAYTDDEGEDRVRINKAFVDPKVVQERGWVYQDETNHLVVHQALSRSELLQVAEKTSLLRFGADDDSPEHVPSFVHSQDPYYEPPLFNPGLEWTPQLDVYSEGIWNYVSFPTSLEHGKKWTRIDNRIVDSEVMDGFTFEMLVRNLLVHAELSMEQIHDLVEMTRTRRMGKGKGKAETVDQPTLDLGSRIPPASPSKKLFGPDGKSPASVPDLDLSRVTAESIDLTAFVIQGIDESSLDDQWRGQYTHIDSRLVEPEVLYNVGLEFEVQERYVAVHGHLSEEEIRALIEQSGTCKGRPEETEKPVIRDAADFGDTPPSPTQPITIDQDLGHSTIDANRLSEMVEEFRPNLDMTLKKTQRIRAEQGPEEKPGKRLGKAVEKSAISRVDTRGSKRGGESWRDGRGEKDRQQSKLDRILAGDMKEDETRHYRDEDSDTPPSPIQQPSHIIPDEGTRTQHDDNPALVLDLDTINLKDYYNTNYTSSRSHTRWTRVDKRLVDAQVLIDAGEEFDDGGKVFYVHRVLRRVEVQMLAQKTRSRRDLLREVVGQRYDLRARSRTVGRDEEETETDIEFHNEKSETRHLAPGSFFPIEDAQGADVLKTDSDFVPDEEGRTDDKALEDVSSLSTANPPVLIPRQESPKHHCDVYDAGIQTGTQNFRWICCNCNADNSVANDAGCADCGDHLRC